MEAHHTPVLLKEVVAALDVRPRGAYIDCTVGEGGHATAVLEAAYPGPRLLGIDLDAEALETAGKRLRGYGERAVLAQGNFAQLGRMAGERGFSPADGILFDLGVSSMQLETADRGFSFSRPGRIDMRFDPTRGLSASEVVNRFGEQELADVVWRFGEERKARRIAAAIVRARPIETTGELAAMVASVGRRGPSGQHPATRTFQALRIFVNRELENIGAGLEQAVRVLRSGGRLVVISYHSLEDRLVKTFVRREASDCVCPPGTPECICGHKATLRLIRRRVIKPSVEEVRANPRSRSARMRVAEAL
jgi:16S rRNA (cytosine1402-N4)-methyltransferase